MLLPQAAVSPPSSGLLGSDKLNFDQLLAQKAARKAESPSPFAERHMAPSSLGAPRSNGRAHSNSNASATLSPLNALTSLNIGGPRAGAARSATTPGVGSNGTSAARANGDVQPLRLDESAERMRDDGDEDDEEEADSPPVAEREAGEDGLGAGIEMVSASLWARWRLQLLTLVRRARRRWRASSKPSPSRELAVLPRRARARFPLSTCTAHPVTHAHFPLVTITPRRCRRQRKTNAKKNRSTQGW